MSVWISQWHGGQAADHLPVLLCLPPAGAGGNQFRSWQPPLAAVAAVAAVLLPGREKRWRDPMPDRFDDVVDAIAAEYVQRFADRPLVIFGHSFGGLIGFELARRLPAARQLVVSSARPPTHWDGAGNGIVQDNAELDRLLDTDGGQTALADQETRQLARDLLRLDAVLSLSYRYAGAPPLDIDMHVWGGAEDEIVPLAQLDEWAEVSGKPLRRRTFAGGHHAVLHQREQVLAALADIAGAASAAFTVGGQ